MTSFFYLKHLEEVPLYTPKAKRVAQTSNSGYPPGYHPGYQPSPSNVTKPKTEKPKSQADKVKIKEKKEVKVVEPVQEISEKLKETSMSDVDPTIEISKKLKRLRKRLRESELLDEKIKAGEAMPNPDQLEKCARRKEFELEIEELEAERLKLRKLKSNKNS